MNDSTKEIILKESHKLFAEKGYNGVSIREIAKVCDVNVAAINYHFKNKENLYVEVFRNSIYTTEKEVKEIYESLEKQTIEELTLKMYRHFVDNSEDLRMSFKMILSQTQFPNIFKDMTNRYPGPPGGEFIHKCLQNEAPKANHNDIEWGVRTIFSQVIHKAIVSCNSSICDQLVSNAGWASDIFEQDLLRMALLVKKELLKTD